MICKNIVLSKNLGKKKSIEIYTKKHDSKESRVKRFFVERILVISEERNTNIVRIKR